MRALLIAFAAAVCPVSLAHAEFSVIGYDREILDHQYENCPPRGSYAYGGCDQCLPINHAPLIPLFQIFCGPARECRMPGDRCPVCNGTCIAIWHVGYTKWFVAWGDADPVHHVITVCNQWLHQSYCPGVTGAYFVGEDFSWIPPRQNSYRDLAFDPLYRDAIAAYTGPAAFSLEDAWRYRIGLFAEMTRRAPPSSRDHYVRAANLAAWYAIAVFAPPDERDQAMAAIGFPLTLQNLEFRDLADIHRATCTDYPFMDCTDPVESTTWGAIKQRYLGK